MAQRYRPYALQPLVIVTISWPEINGSGYADLPQYWTSAIVKMVPGATYTNPLNGSACVLAQAVEMLSRALLGMVFLHGK